MKITINLLALLVCINANAQVCFNPITNYAVGANPQTLISADFNGDSIKDIAVTNNGSHNISILLGTITGTFGASTNFAVGSSPTSIVSADFNGDGKADLAITNTVSNNIFILLGTGTGSFNIVNTIAISSNPYSIISADFNGDGKADLATANGGSSNTTVLLGTGTGSFITVNTFAVGINPWLIISADFNNDGKADLATANYLSSNISVLLGTGTGSFGAATNFTVNTHPCSLTSADFNNDGKTDIAVVANGANNVSVMLGTGTGSFGAITNFALSTNQCSVISADFNNDGLKDIAVSGSSNASVLLGNGAGGFGTENIFSVGATPFTIISADFNSDGRADLATANFNSNTVTVLLNAPSISVKSTKQNICAGLADTLIASGTNTYTWSTTQTGMSIVVSPTVSTTYTVASTYGNCITTKTISVNVNPLPTLIVNSSTICSGNIGTLIASGASTYTWNTGDTTASIAINPSVTTSYTVTGSLDMCNSIAITTITVNNPFNFTLPNVVTPNNDGINDYIDFGKYEFSSLQLDIFNRWGAKVFESANPICIWKPTEDDGTYYYTAQYIINCDTEAQSKTLKGFITVMR